MMPLRTRYAFFTSLSLLFILFTSYYWRREIPTLSHDLTSKIHDSVSPPAEPAVPIPHTLIYKPQATAKALPIVDNFPLAAKARSKSDLPPVPSWNRPPKKHVDEKTPLFIGFTRNWRLLQQVVVSYITAGWPPEDIYVVENTGVMDSNEKGRLSLQNPFFLNHTRLHLLGVNVLITPTLFTFAQLQNFYLWHSIQSDWDHYFWSHMDVVSLSFEDQYAEAHEKSGVPILPPSDPKHDYSDYTSLYKNCLEALREVTKPADGVVSRWAMRFFSYDRLALVNVAAFVEVGGWDTLIPFYMTDCDMHARLDMAKFKIEDHPSGMVFDVASSLDDLLVLYRKKNTPEASFIDPNVVEKNLAEEAALAEEIERNRTLAESKKNGISSRAELPSSLIDRSDDDKTSSAEAWFEYASGVFTSSSDGSGTKWEEDSIHSEQFKQMIQVLDRMQGSKGESTRGRNTWQARQMGGEGEPFYRDSAGFEEGIQMTIEHGRNVFRQKWGHRDCDIVDMGLKQSDAWRVEHDW